MYKTNVNGAVFTEEKTAGVGVLIRDEMGNIVAVMCVKINAPCPVWRTSLMAWLSQLFSQFK